jgi:hypothetical protein
MAQSNKLKQIHEEQVAAARKIFEAYKKFIVEEFIAKYGRSYERPDNLPTRWQDYYEYSPLAEEFLIERTKTFIHVAPDIDRKHQSPAFLKTLIGLVCEYLSLYTTKKGWDRNACTKYLRTMLFDKNQHVQLEMKRYVKENEHAWGQQQKEKRAKHHKQKHRKHIKEMEKQNVILQPEQEQKLRRKFLQHKINQHKKELGMQTDAVVYTDEQKTHFNELKSEYKKYRDAHLIVKISINVNKK